MKKRYTYALLFGVPGLFIAGFISLIAFIPAALVSAQSSGLAQSDPTSTDASAPASASSTPASTNAGASKATTTAPGGFAQQATSAAIAAPAPRTVPPKAPTVPLPPVASSSDFSPTSTIPQADSADDTGFIIAAVTVALAGLGVAGVYSVKGEQNKTKDEKSENRCGSIKELLEQKKKELEEMVRGWPEEKIKSMAKENILGMLKKNETAAAVIEVTEAMQERYEKLKNTIELLQKKFDLCMLSLPEKGEVSYRGTVIESSLNDASILENVEIEKTYQAESRTVHDVVVAEKYISKLSENMNDGPWHMVFRKPKTDEVRVVFKKRTFAFMPSDAARRAEAVAYGRSIGIPEHQLHF